MKRQQAHSESMTNETIFTSDDRGASIYQPDTLVSDQYFENLRRKTHLEPETRLMLAVLEDGLYCYQDNFLPRNAIQKRLFDEAKEWIRSSDDDSVFSFENVCEVLGLDAAYLRQGLLRWKPKLGVVHAVNPNEWPCELQNE